MSEVVGANVVGSGLVVAADIGETGVSGFGVAVALVVEVFGVRVGVCVSEKYDIHWSLHWK